MLLKERQHDRNLKQQIKHIICSVKIDQDTKEKLFLIVMRI